MRALFKSLFLSFNSVLRDRRRQHAEMLDVLMRLGRKRDELHRRLFESSGDDRRQLEDQLNILNRQRGKAIRTVRQLEISGIISGRREKTRRYP